MHPRTEIRKAAAAILKAAGVAGGNVEPSLVRFARANQTPVCGVYALEEAADHQGTSPRTYKRTLTLAVEILHKAVEDLDDALDALAEAAETAMLTDPTLGGKADDCVLVNTLVTIVREGDALHGSCRLDFSIAYRTDEPAATGLDDFALGHVDWDMSPADGQIDARDDIKLPTT